MPDQKSPSTTDWRTVAGCVSIFMAAFCFYMSTVVIRWSRTRVAIDPSFFTFVRFLMGFFVVCVDMAIGRRPLKPVRYHLLFGRALANCAAVYCFYQAVMRTTAAEGNILNMTYPLWIAIYSWFFIKNQRDPVAALMIVVAVAGIWLIVAPKGIDLRIVHLWGVASGIFGAAAVLYLNFSRQHHDTQTILFFMFGLGSLITFGMFFPHFFVPGRVALGYLAGCAGFGIAGQYFITLGFRYVTAQEGSIITSSRILIASLLGPELALEAPLQWTGWCGALLIFSANVVLAIRKFRRRPLLQRESRAT